MVDFSKQLQKADESVARRNYDFAVDLYRQLLEIEPDLYEARAGLRRALKKRDERKGSSQLMRAMSGALPLGKARTLAKLGRHDACARALEDYLGVQPLDEEANLLLAQSLEQAGRLKSARAVYEFLAEIAPKHVVGLKGAGALLRRLGEHGVALEYYERALSIDPRDQEALKARKDLAAEGALKRTDLEGAGHSRERIKDKEQAQRLDLERRRHLSDEELHTELGRAEARLAESANDPDRMLALADLHEKLRDYEAAQDLVERALSYRRDSFEIAARAGDLRVKALKRRISKASAAGDDATADQLERELAAMELEEYRKRVAQRPTDGGLRLQLGRRLMRTGALDEAVAELQKAVPDARARPDALLELGRCFHQKGFLDLARSEYERAAEGAAPGSDRYKEIQYNLGAIAESDGKAAEARARYARVFEIDIGYRDVAAKMEKLRNS